MTPAERILFVAHLTSTSHAHTHKTDVAHTQMPLYANKVTHSYTHTHMRAFEVAFYVMQLSRRDEYYTTQTDSEVFGKIIQFI